jgi:hypothetical protein
MKIQTLKGILEGIEELREDGYQTALELAEMHGVLAPLNMISQSKHKKHSVHQQINEKLQLQSIHALQQCKALIEIINEFKVHKLFIKSIKGPILSYYLYEGKSDWRPSADLDFIYDGSQVKEAYQVIHRLGYQPLNGYPPRNQMEAVKGPSEWIFCHPKTGIEVEFNTSIMNSSYPQALNKIYCSSLGEKISFYGLEMIMPEPEVLWLYLASHASKHQGERLMWYYDLKKISLKFPNLNWERIKSLSIECNLLNCLNWSQNWLEDKKPNHLIWVNEQTDNTEYHYNAILFNLNIQDNLYLKIRFIILKIFKPALKDWTYFPPQTAPHKIYFYRIIRISKAFLKYLTSKVGF